MYNTFLLMVCFFISDGHICDPLGYTPWLFLDLGAIVVFCACMKSFIIYYLLNDQSELCLATYTLYHKAVIIVRIIKTQNIAKSMFSIVLLINCCTRGIIRIHCPYFLSRPSLFTCHQPTQYI